MILNSGAPIEEQPDVVDPDDPHSVESLSISAVTAGGSTKDDRTELIAQIDEELIRLVWSTKEAQKHLWEKFRTLTRQNLSDRHLQEFLADLKAMPDLPSLVTSA